ncbi:nitrite reductase large subunit NirB [Phenylobacterium sp.]|uniref:nitrite reductase large subunit NirB n=1 Tax=Phenylobacterium sp. TaxID=1871053 RepID=UPI0035B2C524
MDPKERLVVVGNGMAGCRTLEELLRREPDRYEITVFGAEPRVNYDRILLSPVLAGEKRFEDIVLNDLAWYAASGITLHAGRAVTAIDREAKVVLAEGGLEVSYDRLLLATGSDPVRLPLPGSDLAGVVTFRDVDDVEAMAAAAERGGSAVVIGGGLLGLEAAAGLARRGMDVTVVHLVDTLMERQLDSAAGFLLRRNLAERGVETLLGAKSWAIHGRGGRVTGLELEDGRTLDADLIVMAVGIRPNVGLARAAGLATAGGVVVDDHMRTSDPAILAVGECVEHRGQTFGLVAPIWEMCRVAARTLADDPAEGFAAPAIGTRLKVTGVDLFSAGEFNGGEDCEDLVFRDAARGVYRRVVVRDGRVAGAVLFGEAGDGAWYLDLMRSGAEVADIRSTLVFGQQITESLRGADPRAAVAAMPDAAEVCGCNGVCKGTITAAIAEKSLDSLDGVRAVTKASASCGSCTPLVEQLLALQLGDRFREATGPKPMCGCTRHGHDHVRRRIVDGALKSIPEVMQALEWTTPDGCAACRPALNYYLLCAWPGEYVDDQQSRYVNERVHANIQKDGTYSVVPRMWGGITTPAELRAIADVAERFSVPLMKVTGGQRIDLFGIRKEDLPAVWKVLNDAGMVSGHAYAKGLRTVKTCVGSEYCRFGTQDSTGLGVKLEKATWGSWTPHKFKMAVSGCPRNCAEATIKDFGVVCVESGYELHVGGNGGIHVRATDLLAKVATEQEAMEWCFAFMQLYREDARYLERTAPWIERIGLEPVKAALDDAANRQALAQRFLFSQRVSQVDPWAERVRGAESHEFRPLANTSRMAAE